jgi:transposase-like protein
MQGAEAAARDAWESGSTEVEIAKTLGVDRMTVRKWLGKR